jgi:hypothetical protein
VKKIIAAILASVVLFAIAGHLEAFNPPTPPVPSVEVPAVVGGLETSRSTGCYANLYNRYGAYAVCRTKGTVFHSWAMCSNGKLRYGPWVRASGFNKSSVWCTPYRIVKQGYQRQR